MCKSRVDGLLLKLYYLYKKTHPYQIEVVDGYPTKSIVALRKEAIPLPIERVIKEAFVPVAERWDTDKD